MPATTQDAVIEVIQRIPEDASVADIMAELYFRNKVDEGLRQLDTGQSFDHDGAKHRLSKWLS